MLAKEYLFRKREFEALSSQEGNVLFLGKETFLEGRITSEGVSRLEGKFVGEILDRGILIVGETGIIRGKFNVNVIVIHGLVEGDVYARERVEIHSTGKLYGNLITPVIIISEGGIFEGHCKMEEPIEGGG